MKCKADGCKELAITLSDFCWEHIKDKLGYREIFISAANSNTDFNGCNLKKAVLKNISTTKINFSKANLSQADLSGSHLFDSNFKGADMVGVDLSGCDLTHCDFEKTDLTKAVLVDSRLWNADFRNANITECDMSRCDLWNSRFHNVKLWHANLSDVKSLTRLNFSSHKRRFVDDIRIDETGEMSAEESYRELKRHFIAIGMYNDASWASFKEKTMERLVFKKRRSLNYLPSLFMSVICGYGEKPYRIIMSSFFTILLFATAFFMLRAIESPTMQGQVLKYADYVYYSAITFTTVGYGDLIPKPITSYRLLAASEAFIGVFFTGLFVFTLARRYSAR